MKPCISEACTMSHTFAEDVAAYADAGWGGIEIWLTKLEAHLEKHSMGDTRKLLEDRQLAPAAAAYQGGLLLSQGEQRRAHYDHFRQRLDMCQQLGIRTMIIAADFGEPVDATALERAVVSLKQAGQWAAGYNMGLALEFRGTNSFCSSLDTAVALIAQCGEANVGINLDMFHYYTGPSKLEDMQLLTPGNLTHVQMCDVAGVPRELASDADRVLPGDGDFQLRPIVTRLKEIGYSGWISLELMNPTLWQTRSTRLAEVGLAALRKLLE